MQALDQLGLVLLHMHFHGRKRVLIKNECMCMIYTCLAVLFAFFQLSLYTWEPFFSDLTFGRTDFGPLTFVHSTILTVNCAREFP